MKYMKKNNLPSLKQAFDFYVQEFKIEFDKNRNPSIEEFPFWVYNGGDSVQDYQMMGFDYHVLGSS